MLKAITKENLEDFYSLIRKRFVITVNDIEPDEDGNIDLGDVGDMAAFKNVKSVNNIKPDSTGNVDIEYASATDIDNIIGGVSTGPDEAILASVVRGYVEQEVATAKQALQITLSSMVLDKAYPVGSIYISVSNVSPQDLFGGTWERISSGRTLWSSDSEGSNTGNVLEAGLPDPDIDVIYRQDSISSGVYSDLYGKDGYTGSAYSNTNGTDEWMQSSKAKGINRPFAAICTNAIYGNSTTVQPPAIVVNMWKRVS